MQKGNPAAPRLRASAVSKLTRYEIAEKLSELIKHPYVREASFHIDGSLIVIYPAGCWPQGVRIPPVWDNRFQMIQRAIVVVNKKLKLSRGEENDRR